MIEKTGRALSLFYKSIILFKRTLPSGTNDLVPHSNTITLVIKFQ